MIQHHSLTKRRARTHNYNNKLNQFQNFGAEKRMKKARKTYAILTFLDLEVVEQGRKDVLGPNRLGNVPKRVDTRTTNRLLVSLVVNNQTKKTKCGKM
jgi:hypothetical protein